ncbi:MAG: cobalt transporter CbiM [Spirulinaceae cyanobacterium]
MHIPDGLLPPSIAIAGYGATGGITWYSLTQINRSKNSQEQIPKASLLTAAFFLASLIHIPLPPTSVHLILNGLMGAILGYYAFPAILIGLFFQAVMFQHGGLSTLGINAIIMGLPALLAHHIFHLRHRLGHNKPSWRGICAFLAGFSGIALGASLYTLLVITNISSDINAQAEIAAVSASLVAYGILAILEGIFTVMLVSFLQQVKPELLEN